MDYVDTVFDVLDGLAPGLISFFGEGMEYFKKHRTTFRMIYLTVSLCMVLFTIFIRKQGFVKTNVYLKIGTIVMNLLLMIYTHAKSDDDI